MNFVNRLETFAGRPCKWNNILIYSPTINEILDVGEDVYYYHLIFSSFDKEKILLDLFKYPRTEYYDHLSNENNYDVLIDNHNIVRYICESLSFFTKSAVTFDTETSSFISEKKMVCDKENFELLSSLIKALNGADEEKKETKFSSSKAKELLEKRNEMLKKINKGSEDRLDLKDILSILCVADGNGINIFNVFDLTVYQVYEHLERMSLKESFSRLLPVWANGHLGKENQLPEWIKKTKL